MTNESEYQQIYNGFLNRIENRLNEYIQIKEPTSLYHPFKYIMSAGGKRIRPALAMVSAGAVGGDPTKALECGIAIEILHNFTLVHDDIMDGSPFRRNNPTIHTKWDEATAILTGDVMIGYAYDLLPIDSEIKNSGKIIKTFSKGLIDVCEGQVYDMMFNKKNEVCLEDYLLMITKKTARILETSAVIGAYCGNGTDENIELLRLYANALGLAFQIQDDLLDITADESELGKSVGLDIIEGKKTILIIKAVQLVKSEKDKKLLNKFISENGLPAEYVSVMKELFLNSGAISEAQNMIDEYLEKAAEYSRRLPVNEYSEMLLWLAFKLNKRKY